jgi:hypothetical protein
MTKIYVVWDHVNGRTYVQKDIYTCIKVAKILVDAIYQFR